MVGNDMSPGIARLWTGISCVGTLVTIAAVMLIFDFPIAVFGTAAGGGFDEFMSLLVFFTAAAGLLMPFDLIGGMRGKASSMRRERCGAGQNVA